MLSRVRIANPVASPCCFQFFRLFGGKLPKRVCDDVFRRGITSVSSSSLATSKTELINQAPVGVKAEADGPPNRSRTTASSDRRNDDNDTNGSNEDTKSKTDETGKEAKFPCKVCSKKFRTGRDLEQHIQSPIHDRKDAPCPHCSSSFKTTSGVAHHLENKSLENVTQSVVWLDEKEKITNPSLNLDLPSDRSGHVRRELLKGLFRNVKFKATDKNYNAEIKAYVCSVGKCARRFKTLEDLNQHIHSPYHKARPDTFMCPQCSVEFSIISALIQHLESPACGLASRVEVKNIYKGLVETFRTLWSS